jgi:arsenate reductase-like glutaredoxin family protein
VLIQVQLMAATGIDKKQLKNWFTNARRRIWKPMMRKQVLSFAALDAHPVTWCRIQKLCINSGDGQYGGPTPR